jgi:hypothetical protein
MEGNINENINGVQDYTGLWVWLCQKMLATNHFLPLCMEKSMGDFQLKVPKST